MVQELDRRAVLAGGGAVCVAGATRAQQDAYPSRPIRVIVPFAAAAGIDITMRKLGDALGARMGKPFVIENKPGAGGTLGTAEIARAPRDGYTLGMVNSAHVINPFILKSVPFDALADITPISIIGTVAIALLVHPSFPAKTVSELIALAKAKPGQFDYGSAGTGTVIHLAGALFNKEAGVDIKHVPYRGSGPLANDLLAGHVKIGYLGVPAVLPQIEAGLLRPLAVSTAKRDPKLPDVPTMAEAGLSNYSLDSWAAFIGPKALPDPIVQRLYREVKAVMATDKFKAELADIATIEVGSDPEEARKFLASELEKHRRIVADAGISAE